jgi:hypothetical protein
MIDTQLILLEGVSGSGKSFTSHLLAMHLQRNSYAVDWIYENQIPHPIYHEQKLNQLTDQFIAVVLQEQLQNSGQATVVDYLTRLKHLLLRRPTLFDVQETALSNWQNLVAQTLANGHILLMDASFFQATLETLLAVEISEEKMLAHILAIERIIAPLKPVLIHLYHDDVIQQTANNFAQRGADFRDYIHERLIHAPYAQSRRALGIEQTAIAYFQDYARLISRFADQLSLPVLAINNTAGDWSAYNHRIADFLAIPALEETCQPITPVSELAGCYQLAGADDVLEISEENQRLTLTAPTRLRLFHKLDNRFCVEGTLNECCFVTDSENKVDSLIYTMPEVDGLEFRKVNIPATEKAHG